ncbi:MAG: hypothetical protein GY761_07160 [Hyphomicrobiales bacterium]|nr:hypothetical protein [Hyphomicrobiales bacterium]
MRCPPKTSRTSSKPPSTDKKARREHAKPGSVKRGHEGHHRALHENPDETIDHDLIFALSAMAGWMLVLGQWNFGAQGWLALLR